MVALTILFLVMGIAGPFIGRVVDRYGVRRVIAVGAVIAGLGFVLLSRVHTLWHFYCGYGVVGVGIASMGMVPATAVVSNWFERRRGTAIGIMSTGVGAGGLVLAPVIGSYLIPNFGWRTSYLALACITWVLVIPLALLVLKSKPANLGLYPDGTQTLGRVAEVTSSPSATEGFDVRTALATSGQWL